MIDLKALPQSRFHVLGFGLSGRSAALALKAAGKEVAVWDDVKEKRAVARDLGFEVSQVLSGDVLVVSPGVLIRPDKAHDLIGQAREKTVPMTNDVGLFRDLNPDKTLVAITGTNGKSTTTAMIGHILKEAGKAVAVGGNLGTPVLDLDQDADIFVLELSSYQLETAPSLGADVALLLNITPDHIDHHGSMEAYVAAKQRIFEGAKLSVFGDRLEYASGTVHGYDLAQLERLKGEHNWQNIASAFAVCRALGLDNDVIWSGVRSFPGLPHRQYLVRVINNVAYVNDSKATNADATQKALRSFDNIYLIAGGLAKEGGLNGLESDMGGVRHAFLIGQAEDEFAVWLDRNNVPFTKCETLDVAVKAAHAAAQASGEAASVLLSPACASWDQFQSFEHRGTLFEEMVRAL